MNKKLLIVALGVFATGLLLNKAQALDFAKPEVATAAPVSIQDQLKNLELEGNKIVETLKKDLGELISGLNINVKSVHNELENNTFDLGEFRKRINSAVNGQNAQRHALHAFDMQTRIQQVLADGINEKLNKIKSLAKSQLHTNRAVGDDLAQRIEAAQAVLASMEQDSSALTARASILKNSPLLTAQQVKARGFLEDLQAKRQQLGLDNQTQPTPQIDPSQPVKSKYSLEEWEKMQTQDIIEKLNTKVNQEVSKTPQQPGNIQIQENYMDKFISKEEMNAPADTKTDTKKSTHNNFGLDNLSGWADKIVSSEIVTKTTDRIINSAIGTIEEWIKQKLGLPSKAQLNEEQKKLAEQERAQALEIQAKIEKYKAFVGSVKEFLNKHLAALDAKLSPALKKIKLNGKLINESIKDITAQVSTADEKANIQAAINAIPVMAEHNIFLIDIADQLTNALNEFAEDIKEEGRAVLRSSINSLKATFEELKSLAKEYPAVPAIVNALVTKEAEEVKAVQAAKGQTQPASKTQQRIDTSTSQRNDSYIPGL